jgi:arylsulfatase A-like enzyme
MADDHAAHAISAYGSRINQTPQIDRLAREGVRFDRCFAVNSICTPSRASILTGKYSHMNGVPVFNRFDGTQPTVAKYLQQAGYYTGMIGKWHLGTDPTGFDFWTILPGQGVYQNPDFLDRNGRRNIPGYATDIITDLALDFLRNRPKDKPFFLMCHHKAPHRPWDPDDKHARLFDDRDIPEPPTLRDDYATRTDAARETTMTIARDLTRRDLKLTPPPGLQGPELNRWYQVKPAQLTLESPGGERVLTGEAFFKWKYQRYIKDYLRCIASVDDNVGRLLDFLDQQGLRENTLVVYTSDQGFFLGDHGWYDKRFMYEESIKMPLLVRWPAGIPAGAAQPAMALNVDFAPTFMDLAGLKPAADMQGRSLRPLLRGERPANWRKSWYYRYYHDPGDHNTRAHYGVRTDTHKLIYFWKKNQWECYDLEHDPAELRNLYGDPAQAGLVAELKRELYRLKAELNDQDQFAIDLPPPGVDGQPAPRPASPRR